MRKKTIVFGTLFIMGLLILLVYGDSINYFGRHLGYEKSGTYIVNMEHNSVGELRATNSAQTNAKALSDVFQAVNGKRKVLVVIPSGKYKITNNPKEPIVLPSNTKVEANHNTKFILTGWLSFYGIPTGRTLKDGVNNFYWRGGQFIGDGRNAVFSSTIVHGNNLKFTNIIFNRVSRYDSHVFDLNAVMNVTFKGNKFLGYGDGRIQPEQAPYHTSIAEAIQLDTADYNVSYGPTTRKVIEGIEPRLKAYSSNLGDQNIVIKDNEFRPINIRNVEIASQPAIGHHVGNDKNTATQNIKIQNNIFENPFSGSYVVKNNGKRQDNNYLGTIHLTAMSNVLIENNQFLHTDQHLIYAWITAYQDNNRINMHNINIKNNVFSDTNIKYANVLMRSGTTKEKKNGFGEIDNIYMINNKTMLTQVYKNTNPPKEPVNIWIQAKYLPVINKINI